MLVFQIESKRIGRIQGTDSNEHRKSSWYWLIIAITRVKNQHSYGHTALILPVDNLSGNAA